MDDFLDISVKIEGFDKEMQKEIDAINKRIPIALNNVGSEMINDLSRHLDEDFYNKYSPVAYRRRYDKGLKNKSKMSPTVKGHTLEFTYLPSGSENMGTLRDSLNWSEKLEKYLKSQNTSSNRKFFTSPHEGDDLIVWAQKQHEIGAYKIPARPFWNNFVEEQKNGKMLQTFAKFMQPYSIIYDEQDSSNLFANNESLLEYEPYQQTFKDIGTPTTNIDEELFG